MRKRIQQAVLEGCSAGGPTASFDLLCPGGWDQLGTGRLLLSIILAKLKPFYLFASSYRNDTFGSRSRGNRVERCKNRLRTAFLSTPPTPWQALILRSFQQVFQHLPVTQRHCEGEEGTSFLLKQADNKARGHSRACPQSRQP